MGAGTFRFYPVDVSGMTPSRSLAQNNTPIRKQFLLGMAVVLLLACTYWPQWELDRRQNRTVTQMGGLAQLPDGKYLKPALLGYHNLGADVLWLQLLQVLGKKKNTVDEYEQIYHVMDVITTLDPHYNYVYYVGGVALTNIANRVDLSNRLLEKGFKENPKEWSIPFLLGYNHYFVLGDAAKAAEYIAAAARLPDGPAYLPGLATRMYAEANNPETALHFLETLWRQTLDSEMRDVLEKRAKEVMIERDIRRLESAVQRYRTKQGHFPGKLHDLVISGDVAQLPEEPYGGSYELNSKTGKVSSSTHPDRLKVFRLDMQGSM